LAGRDPKEIASHLRGNTALIYWYMIKRSSPTGVREVQRALGLSSPSVAHHHLEKLKELGLVEKDGAGEYRVLEKVSVGLLRFFVRLGRFVLPRYVFYASLTTTMLLGYLVAYRPIFSPESLMVIIFGSVASSIFWYESVRILREAPF